MSQAFLSIDVEDYYHLEYYEEKNRNTDYSMLDGLELFLDLCETESIPPNLFVLSDVVKPAKNQIERAIKMGGKIGLHGLDHKRPLTLSLKRFRKDTIKAKQIIEDSLGYELNGYRAACFSLNREYLESLIDMGFAFESSYINFRTHPLYGYIDLDGFTDNQNGIFENKNFREYEMTVPKIFKKNLPVTGGAYFRILPYALVEALTKKIFNENKIVNFYTHPFELSSKSFPRNNEMTLKDTFRSSYKKGDATLRRMKKFIKLVKDQGYKFSTYE